MIDVNKNYTTRDGFPVRIIATDAKGRYPVVGLVDLGDVEYTRQWTEDGKADYRDFVKMNYDLIEARPQQDYGKSYSS